MMIFKRLDWLLYRAPANLVMWRVNWRHFGNQYDWLLRVAAREGVTLMRLQDGRWASVAVWKGRRAA